MPTVFRTHFRLATSAFGSLFIIWLSAEYSRTRGFHRHIKVTRWAYPGLSFSTAGSLYICGRGFSWCN